MWRKTAQRVSSTRSVFYVWQMIQSSASLKELLAERFYWFPRASTTVRLGDGDGSGVCLKRTVSGGRRSPNTRNIADGVALTTEPSDENLVLKKRIQVLH